MVGRASLLRHWIFSLSLAPFFLLPGELEPSTLAQVAAVVSHALGPEWEQPGLSSGAGGHRQGRALQATIATQQVRTPLLAFLW